MSSNALRGPKPCKAEGREREGMPHSSVHEKGEEKTREPRDPTACTQKKPCSPPPGPPNPALLPASCSHSPHPISSPTSTFPILLSPGCPHLLSLTISHRAQRGECSALKSPASCSVSQNTVVSPVCLLAKGHPEPYLSRDLCGAGLN